MHTPSSRLPSLVASATAATLMLTACGGGSDDDSDSAPAPATRGTIAVSLAANAPACGFDAVNVAISKLRFRQDVNPDPNAGGWTELSFTPARRLNLLHPAGAIGGSSTELGEITLPAGDYTQMAVVLDGAAGSIKPAGAAGELPLETAATAAGGVRLPINLKVEDGKKAELLFELNVCDSLQPRGAAYVLMPRPRLPHKVASGIGGFVDPAALPAGVVVTAQKGGTILATAVPHPTTGEFLLPRLAPDSYEVVMQGNGRATAVIGAVPVASGGVTRVGSTAAPIRLASSAVSTISGQVTYAAPAVAPADGTWIMASQTINADAALGNATTTVTNRLQAVDLASGNYTLPNLARASIQYALYKPNAALAPVNAATSGGNGRYRIEALATGYINKTGSSANINVSSGNAPGVNISMP